MTSAAKLESNNPWMKRCKAKHYSKHIWSIMTLTSLTILLTGMDKSFGTECCRLNECKNAPSSLFLSSPHLLPGICLSLNSLEYNLSITAADTPPSGWAKHSRLCTSLMVWVSGLRQETEKMFLWWLGSSVRVSSEDWKLLQTALFFCCLHCISRETLVSYWQLLIGPDIKFKYFVNHFAHLDRILFFKNLLTGRKNNCCFGVWTALLCCNLNFKWIKLSLMAINLCSITPKRQSENVFLHVTGVNLCVFANNPEKLQLYGFIISAPLTLKGWVFKPEKKVSNGNQKTRTVFPSPKS